MNWRYLTILLLWASTAGAADKPNVLWICADDHAPYVCGAYGNSRVKTPNLDRLAGQGMRFDRAYCNSPVCTASRQSFLTGRYPRTNGVTQLKTALPESETTLAELLRNAGYRTASFGKMHFNSALKHGFEERLDQPDFAKALKARGKAPLPAGVETLPQWRPFKDPAAVWLNSGAKPFASTDADMAGTYFAAQAERYLRKPGEKPWFLVVSFYEPHSPFNFPVEFRNRHSAAEFVASVVGPEDDWQVPAIFRDLKPLEKQGIQAAYYTSVEFMDRNVGRVLDALEQSGEAKNTLVVYTGDHGYMLGQHGRFEKHCCFEPAIRAPLLVRYPPAVQPAKGTNALVEFIDIAPTILDYCGVAIPSSIQGRTLRPVLAGKASTHREEVFVEYSENEEAAIRTSRWKLIYGTGKRARQDGYETGRPLPGRNVRLYDMESDPEELRNLANEPAQAGRVAELTARLAEHLRKTARQPELLPKTDDVHALLEHCLQPRDVGS